VKRTQTKSKRRTHFARDSLPLFGHTLWEKRVSLSHPPRGEKKREEKIEANEERKRKRAQWGSSSYLFLKQVVTFRGKVLVGGALLVGTKRWQGVL